jgi:DNA-binding transcriptional MerR regulator/predicted O-methyltransferase YrrM
VALQRFFLSGTVYPEGAHLMRIGKFAESNHIGLDTVRHYMELGLLIADKPGGQYVFDDRCQHDLNEIMELKEMGFALKDIKQIFLYQRLGKHTSFQENQDFIGIFKEQLLEVERKLELYQGYKRKITDKMSEQADPPKTGIVKLGLNLKQLGLLQCSECKSEFILQEGQIVDNCIQHGLLQCRCGKRVMVEDGIVLAESHRSDGLPVKEDRISEYIAATDEAYLRNINSGLEWNLRALKAGELGGKVILELGTGLGFFLRSIYADLPEDCLYIAVDHSLPMQAALKRVLERTGLRRNVLFICSDFLDMPLKQSLADVILDIAGSSNYAFEHKDFLLPLINQYIRKDALLLGNYILFGKFSPHSQIAEGYRSNFQLNPVRRSIEALGFRLMSESGSDLVDKGGIYEDYFQAGEKVNTWRVLAKRLG